MFCRCRGYSIHYIWRCRRCSSSSRTLTSPSWRRGFSHGPDLFGFFLFFFSPSCRTCSGCPGCAVSSSATGCSSKYKRRCTRAATSSSSSLCRMGPRPVHRPLCWERLRGILLRPSRGYAPFNDECGNFLGDPDGFVRRIICPCLYRVRSKRFCAEDQGFLSEEVQFPFGFASWQDPNVSVQRIEASFRK